MTSVDLARRIALGDVCALHEVCTRLTWFTAPFGRSISFGEFVEQACASPYVRRRYGDKQELMEKIRNEVVDRCLIMHDVSGSGRRYSRRRGCRNAFRAILEAQNLWCAKHPMATEEEKHAALVQHMAAFVDSQVKHACREASRAGFPGRMRVSWWVGTCKLVLWMPRAMTVPERNLWLEEHALGCEPDTPGGQQRVQWLIDECLHAPVAHRMPLEPLYSTAVARPTGFANLETRERMVSLLALLVADEVVRDFAALHPSVQVVGKQKLRLLIHAIFDSLLSNTYNQAKLSREFGISKAALSRFAGLNRCPEPGPDNNGTLWAIAKRIAETHRDALEAA